MRAWECFRALTDRFQRAGEIARKRCALLGRPPLESVSTTDVETLEKRARVQQYGRQVVASAGGVAELDQIARHPFRIQPQIARVQQQICRTELATQRVDELLERRARPLFIAIRPEQGREGLARQPAWAGAGEQRKCGERLPLPRELIERRSVSLEMTRSESADTQHVASRQGG